MAKQDIDVEGWIRRYDNARGRRSTWDAHWREVDEFFWPRSDGFTGQGYGSGNLNGGGEKRTEKVFDITAPLSLSRGASGLSALVIPQSEKWHTLRASVEELNEDPSVKKWFEQVNKLLFAMRSSPAANFYAQAHEGLMSILAYGNHCQYIDENPRGGARYRGIHIGQVWIDVDHQGRVDTLYRRLPLSAKAAQQQFGEVWGDNVPAKIAAALLKGDPAEFDFVHITAPRENVDTESFGAESMPWIDLHILPEERLLIQQGGQHEMPYQYPRWSISPNESHGRGPGMLTLPRVKVLNQQERTLLRSGHLAVDPPLLMGDDNIFGSGSKTPRFQPGAAYYNAVNSQGRQLVIPLETGAKIDITHEMMNASREQLQGAFMLDLFRMFTDNPNMTATEVNERVAEKGQLLAPAIGRIQSEWLGPQIHRELAILGRQRLLPPLPPVLLEAGASYEVEYVAQAQRMQRARELVAIQRTIELVTPLAAIDPILLKKLNGEKVIQRSMDILGGPSDVLETPEDFAEIQKQAAEAAAQAQQLAMLQAGAGAAKDGASAMAAMQGGQQASAA